MENNMETTIMGYRGYIILGLYWGYIGIMENKMETHRDYRDYIGVVSVGYTFGQVFPINHAW